MIIVIMAGEAWTVETGIGSVIITVPLRSCLAGLQDEVKLAPISSSLLTTKYCMTRALLPAAAGRLFSPARDISHDLSPPA